MSHRFWWPSIASAALTAAIGTHADAQPSGPVPIVESEEVQESTGNSIPSDDASVPAPNHPPIHTIPPMPMPARDADERSERPNGLGVAVSFDLATRQETRRQIGDDGIDPSPPVPSDLNRGGGYAGADGGQAGGQAREPARFGEMRLISPAERRNPPWRRHVKIIMRFGSVNYVCSGTLVDPEVVLTAGHCIHDQDLGGWADEVWVYPGWDGSERGALAEHYGLAKGRRMHATEFWTADEKYEYDVGEVTLTRAVGMLTGWLGWAWGRGCSESTSRFYGNASYPEESCGSGRLHSGTDMYYWNGQFDSCHDEDGDGRADILRLNNGGSGCLSTLWGGMSGSSAYYTTSGTDYAHAVASHTEFRRGDPEKISLNSNYTKLNSDWKTLIHDAAVPDARGSAFDLQALDTTVGSTTVAAGGRTTFTHLATNPTNGSANKRFTYRIYLSTNDNISSTDSLLSTQSYSRSFDAMDSVRMRSSIVTIPANTPPGDYFVGMIYDAVTDSDASNNDTDGWDTARITVTQPLSSGADLVVWPPRVSDATLNPGQSFTLSMNIHNQGSAASAVARIRYYRSTDSTIETTDTAVGSGQVQSLGVATSTFRSITLSAPSSPGTYYYGACVGGIQESDTNNNCSNGVAVTVGGGVLSDRDVLVALYRTTGGPNWIDRTNWLTNRPLSEWFGVNADASDQVSLVILGYNQLSGTIPPELGQLAHLEWLSLDGNQLSGTIPAALGNRLANLKELHLGSNQLSGTIPAALGNLANLQYLFLHDNQLSGSIPTTLGNLANLRDLGLSDNQLSGSIPAALGNLTSLEYLTLDGNQLSGSIPAQLGNLTSLKTLTIDNDTGLCLASDFPPASSFARLAQERGVGVCGANVPDLIVEPPTVSDDTLTPGQSFMLSATVRNQGSAPSDATMLHYFYTIPGFTLFLHVLQVPSLAADGASFQSTIHLRAPSDPGTHLYYACVDGVSGESDTENNCSSSVEVTVTDAADALMITSNGGGERATITVQENRTVVTTVTASGGTPPYEFQWSSSQTAPDGVLFTMNTATGALAFVSAPDYENPTDSDRDNNYVLTVYVQDASQPSQHDEQTITVTVTDEAEPGDTSDRAVLEALYHATGGPNWTDNTNWLSNEPVGEWFGVTTAANGRVTKVELPGNLLRGTILPELGNLAFLEVLDFGPHPHLGWVNQLSGSIPSSLGNLANLEHLILGSNQLSGTIPAELGYLANLETLFLYTNELSGPIPAVLGSLTNLKDLFLWGNQLTGPIPAALDGLANLERLVLSRNALSGPIPPALARLTNLTLLNLKDNELTGPVPRELAQLTRLEWLQLGGNQLSGPLAWLGGMTTLLGLDLWNLGLSGPIPTWLRNLTDLKYLRLTGNALSGPIPTWVGDLRGLWFLSLHGNALSGPVPSELGNLSMIQDLYLSENPLTGVLPPSLTQVSPRVFWIQETGVCVPAEPAFQTWLATIEDFRGDICGAPGSGFTDDPIVAGETPVRALHFTELRQRIDALRATQGLSRFGWTDSTLAAGVAIRGVHMAELRTALRQAYDAAGRTTGFSTKAPQAGWAIHAWHINELRRWVVALEQ